MEKGMVFEEQFIEFFMSFEQISSFRLQTHVLITNVLMVNTVIWWFDFCKDIDFDIATREEKGSTYFNII
jgi:hypothetical protein